MQHVAIDGKQEFLAQLREQLAKRLPQEKVKAIAAFAEDFYASAPFEDLAERHLDDIYGATLNVWHFMQQHDPKSPKVGVYNPDFEKHGWQSSHTVIGVLQQDMPFLVDSVRIELNRRGITVHAIHNAVLAVDRDKQHRLKRVTSVHDEQAPETDESVIVIEIDRHSDPAVLEDLETSIRDVLRDVRTAVEDFEAMRGQVGAALDELKASRPDQIGSGNHEEAIAFLEWLRNDNFTFLGYDEYEVVKENGQDQLCHVKDSDLGVFKLDQPRYRERIRNDLGVEDDHYVLVPELLSFAKSAYHSRVHRPAYPDYICVDRYDADGNVIGERRFLGLYAATVYNDSPRHIPILRKKIQAVIQAVGVDPRGHDGHQLRQILNVYPRDDLFQISTEELTQTTMGILNIRERRRVRLFIREDRFGRFYSCLVFVPRDVFSTDLRVRIQNLLCDELDATFGDFNTYLSESVLARIQLILRFNGEKPVDYDIRRLEKKVGMLSRSWRDDLQNAMVEGFGEEQANQLMDRYREAFPGSYRDDFSARTAVYDLHHIGELEEGEALALSLYRLVEEDEDGVNLKLFHADRPVPLSDVLPMMENLGLRVLGERPYNIQRQDRDFWIHDFDLEHHSNEIVNLQEMRDTFIEAFKRIWVGDAENDPFNRLVIGANLAWREVAVLRAYARYLKQLRFGLSQLYIATTLASYPEITRELVTLFELRFDPDQQAQEGEIDACLERINGQLDAVASLNDDLLLRRYAELIQATLRTNYYQLDENESYKEYIALKLEPAKIPDMPKPRPMYEIFIYSPRVEGVHLRGGKVARGGLRWSDRHEDFRTEVLGLVKAQQVKNAVIVPVGAKGGFVCKRMPDTADRDVIQKEGIACYQIFIRALLDVTDNLVGGEIVPPRNVVRHDDDDPYLVVAADKGTATFSDIANAISLEYGHWLGDAFASGGANGYDHKKMAITARGAWESVKRHFRELGVDTQQDEFTVLGIGDMAGDVFGNGMLLSDKIRLVGAFNHMHIFIDPDPDPAASFKERKRLFDQPRSSWEEYDSSLISEGGGIFKRSAKSVAITPQMKQVFGIEADKLSPNDLINAMLKSQVDLIWNGGIGTYVKSREESHADVGDKANDSLRVNGEELRCRVVGEGGNLGLTQRGRMEAARKGVRVNTDFIDNSGGVDCSDHEVNIKILLDDVVKRGDMTDKQRNQLLAEMTEEVADLVLQDNYRQAQALSLSRRLSQDGLGPFRRFINELEAHGQLDRELEFLPSDEVLLERSNADEGLTLPELSVLISYAKSTLKSDLIASEVPDDPYIQTHLERAFPRVLVERFRNEMYEHRLKREIAATQIANDLVDHMGIVFMRRLIDSTGSGRADITRAYVVARDSFNLESLWQQIEALDNKVDSEVQYAMMQDLMRLLRRATRWFLRHRTSMTIKESIEHFAPRLAQLQESIGDHLRGDEYEAWQVRCEELSGAGVPDELARVIAATRNLYGGLGIIEAANQANEKVQRVAEVYFEIGHRLELPWMTEQVNALKVRDAWQAQARETFRDDLDRQQLALTVSVLNMEDSSLDVGPRVEQWLSRHSDLHERWCGLVNEVRHGAQGGFPLFAVAIRELVDLAESNGEA
ncbi:NAD-glutamate dehydrogenase [Halomonas sp. McH1-25]|uniref:NAD-glutamate dehydrogenase n=1 Tax=unclassified Halomonas TaxID=2609666 RepID=UPI001EF63974|nr:MULTISPECIES: NAD-glutamate dehydrogenase [unclassified Halomonas]MCG7600936.1 NAD-glutamate dehydrogenase [Halomonas sp. McH1-25]MCP1341524.1 NAD-glutamate dehydrogenase [Halomonas sp. FL8]MCP1359790.1 NAD-glutamate dehydrogenase [Halomonas sp. BBD45]